jgi:hypothetical protein
MEFIAKGRLTFIGVDFYIDADTLAEARQKCVDGSYRSYDLSSAEVEDCDIRRTTLEENK